MKKTEQQWQRFARHTLTRDEQRRTKGGHVHIPSGTGSTGLIGWDEIDIRANDNGASGRGRKPIVSDRLLG